MEGIKVRMYQSDKKEPEDGRSNYLNPE